MPEILFFLAFRVFWSQVAWVQIHPATRLCDLGWDTWPSEPQFLHSLVCFFLIQESVLSLLTYITKSVMPVFNHNSISSIWNILKYLKIARKDWWLLEVSVKRKNKRGDIRDSEVSKIWGILEKDLKRELNAEGKFFPASVQAHTFVCETVWVLENRGSPSQEIWVLSVWGRLCLSHTALRPARE